jgi:hypothetical protein
LPGEGRLNHMDCIDSLTMSRLANPEISTFWRSFGGLDEGNAVPRLFPLIPPSRQ